MSLDISKITNQKLRKLANECDNTDKNYGNLNQEEFELFRSEAGKIKGVSSKAFNQAMGLYVSVPNATTDAEIDELKATETEMSASTESNRTTTGNKKQEKAQIDALEKHLTYAVNIKDATLETLISCLPKELSKEDVADIQAVLDMLPEYESVKDVKKQHKALVNEIGKSNKKQIFQHQINGPCIR